MEAAPAGAGAGGAAACFSTGAETRAAILL